jgi:hypothetical protein
MNQISHVQTGQSFKSLLRDGPAVRDIAAERLHRKQRLAATFRLFAPALIRWCIRCGHGRRERPVRFRRSPCGGRPAGNTWRPRGYPARI